MPTDREIALHQALIAVLIEVHKAGLDLDELAQQADASLIGGKISRIVEHPHVDGALREIKAAKQSVQAMLA